MELFKKFNKLSKKKRWEISENNAPKIAQTLEVSEEVIPNWKVFNINEIAEINPWTNQIITLKNVKPNKYWEKYIEINWRKYYEFNWKWHPKDSMYILKWSSLFIWDLFEWLTNRDGVSFRYSRWIWKDTSFEQRKTKYAWWAMHLKEIYKSESFYNTEVTDSTNEVISVIEYWWESIEITKDMIDQYLNSNWWLNKKTKNIIETAILTDPEIFNYIRKIK